jgi:hypothetical protein
MVSCHLSFEECERLYARVVRNADPQAYVRLSDHAVARFSRHLCRQCTPPMPPWQLEDLCDAAFSTAALASRRIRSSEVGQDSKRGTRNEVDRDRLIGSKLAVLLEVAREPHMGRCRVLWPFGIRRVPASRARHSRGVAGCGDGTRDAARGAWLSEEGVER